MRPRGPAGISLINGRADAAPGLRPGDLGASWAAPGLGLRGVAILPIRTPYVDVEVRPKGILHRTRHVRSGGQPQVAVAEALVSPVETHHKGANAIHGRSGHTLRAVPHPLHHSVIPLGRRKAAEAIGCAAARPRAGGCWSPGPSSAPRGPAVYSHGLGGAELRFQLITFFFSR